MKEFNLKLDKTAKPAEPTTATTIYAEKVIYILPPVPTSYLWHRETHFRHIQELKEANNTLFQKWREEGKIPEWALSKIK